MSIKSRNKLKFNKLSKVYLAELTVKETSKVSVKLIN